MRLLPKSALSTAVGFATRAPAPAGLHQLAVRTFARAYQVSVHEAERELSEYRTFGDFFTRRLKEGVRPVAPGEKVLVSPVDGHVSQAGVVKAGRCIQAKGIAFPAAELLGDPEEAAAFEGGAFTTLYLSPRDYHRIHAPLGGHIVGYSYLPGELWPVSPRVVRGRPSLYSLNERLVTHLQTPAGKVALVAVGATCVSRIHAAYDTLVTHSGEPGRTHRYERPIEVKKGAEVGMFEMGSTVLLLTQPGRVRWDEGLKPLAEVRVGARIGEAS
ncbi:MAG: archaetidylserine decarboxylase [Myxococcaceae bacterium]